jgi:hypothetical protein
MKGEGNMNKVDPKEFIDENEELQDQICSECNTLIVKDLETGERLCNCNAKAEEAAQLAAAMKERRQTAPAQPAARPVPENTAPLPEQPVIEEDPADAVPQEEMPVFSAKDALRAIPGAPEQEQINAWKQEWGKIYTFPFDSTEIYIWRPMRRREWQMLQANEALVKEEAKFQEQVVMRSVLYPQIGPVELNLSRAGLVQTLFSVIMQGSYFLHPDFAITLVEEL